MNTSHPKNTQLLDQPKKTLESTHKKLVDTFRSGKTRDYEFRILQLKSLLKGIQENEELIVDAVYKDLKRTEVEALAELSILKEIRFFLKNLKKLMHEKKFKHHLAVLSGKIGYVYEPLGTCLIISPFNFPFALAFMPLIGALAAGNTALIKTSEHAVHSAAVIKK